MTAYRQGYDLFNPHCRKAAKDNFKRNWRWFPWWKSLFLDTVNRKCSKPTNRSSNDPKTQ